MNQSATHYFIGGNCVNNQELVTQAVDSGGHLAIHTWSHPYMTTLTNYQVLGELGWTAQIIYDLSGMIPADWRPPYGDVDNRVRAIAKEVFGLSTTIWNADTDDWCLSEGGGASCGGEGPADDAALDALMQGFASGPKSPGLMVLEHELSTRAVGGFTRNYALMLSSGWEVLPIPDLWNFAWYLNSPSASGPVDASVRVGNGGGGPVVISTIGAASPSSTEPSSIVSEALPSATISATPVGFDSALGHPAAAAATGATSGAGASSNAATLSSVALMVWLAAGSWCGA